MIIKKRDLDKIIKRSIKAVEEGGIGIRGTDEFSYRGFRVQVIVETEVIRSYELPIITPRDTSQRNNGRQIPRS